MRHKELDTSLICIYNLLNNCNNNEKECVSIIEQLNKKIIQQTTFLQNFQNSLKEQFNFTNAIKQLPDINSHQNEINILKQFEKHMLIKNNSTTSQTFQSLISIFSSFSERNTLRSEILRSYQCILSSDFLTNQLYLKLKKLILSKNNEKLNTQFNEYEKRYLLDALQKPIEFSIEFYILLQSSKKWEYDKLFFLLTEFENQEEILKELKKCYNQSKENEGLSESGKLTNSLSKEEINQLPFNQIQKRIATIQNELKYLQKRNVKMKKEWRKNSSTLPLELQDTQILKSSFSSTLDKPSINLAPAPKKSPKSKSLDQKSPKKSPHKTPEKEEAVASGNSTHSAPINESVNIVNNPIHATVVPSSISPSKSPTAKLKKKGSQRSPRKYFKTIKSNESKAEPTQLSISLSSSNLKADNDLSSGSATSESDQKEGTKAANRQQNLNLEANLRSSSNEIKHEKDDDLSEKTKEKRISKPADPLAQKQLLNAIELSTDNDTDKISEISSSQNTDVDNKSVEINYLHEDTSSNEDTHSSTRRKDNKKKLERERSLDISQVTGENEETSESAYPYTPHPHLQEENINFMGTSNDPIDTQLISSSSTNQPTSTNDSSNQSNNTPTRKSSKTKKTSKNKRKSKNIETTESETDTTESSINSNNNNQSGSSKDRPIVNGNSFDYKKKNSSDNLRLRNKSDSKEDLKAGVFNAPVNQQYQKLKRHSSASSKKYDVRRSLHLDLNAENKRKGTDDTIIIPPSSSRQHKLPSASKTMDHSNLSSIISSPFDMDGIGAGGRGNQKILVETLMGSAEANNEVKIRDLTGKKRKKINSCPKREQSIFENFNFSPRNVKNAIQTKLPELLTPRSIIHHSPHSQSPSNSPKTTNPVQSPRVSPHISPHISDLASSSEFFGKEMKSESGINDKPTFELFHNVRTSRYSIKCVSAESRENEKTKAKKKRIAIKSAGYWLEEGGMSELTVSEYDRNIIQPPLPISDQQEPLELEKEDIGVGEWFSYYFHLQSHSNYVSRTSPDGFVVLSIKKEKNLLNNTDLRRLLYRSSKVTIGILIPTSKLRSGIRRGSSLAQLLHKINPLLRTKHFIKCESDIAKDLLEFENLELIKITNQKQFKFGILNWKEGNRDEDDMFTNNEISNELKMFMSILGDQIELQSWTDYSGGLDTSQKSESGKYSLFTNYEGNKIMFHVAPFIPAAPKNRQQIERKRHIGNDVVVIIFKENQAPYLTSIISSHFTHVFIIVTAETSDSGEHYYRVAVVAQEGVPPFGPPLPEDGIFYNPWNLRQFLLQKMINGERAAARAPAFTNRIAKSRHLILKNIVECTI